jgi:1-acylglycerone phosphate reductase
MRESVLITGCSVGSAGNQLAKEYCSRGISPLLQKSSTYSKLPGLLVFATARKMEAMNDLDAPGIKRLELDVTNIESIRNARDSLKVLLGNGIGLDILVNNAGVAGTNPAWITSFRKLG